MLYHIINARLGYAGQTVLQDVDITVKQGEKIALLGESGGGKTTLLRHLRGMRPAEVAWCPQQPGLVPSLSVYHNLYMGLLDQHAWYYNLLNLVYPLAGACRQIEPLAETLGLSGVLYMPAGEVSGGQQTRINLGRALIQRRAVFLGDEPVSAVDETQADQLLGLICASHSTVIVALHDIELALRHCSRVIGLRDGRIALDRETNLLTSNELLDLYSS